MPGNVRRVRSGWQNVNHPGHRCSCHSCRIARSRWPRRRPRGARSGNRTLAILHLYRRVAAHSNLHAREQLQVRDRRHSGCGRIRLLRRGAGWLPRGTGWLHRPGGRWRLRSLRCGCSRSHISIGPVGEQVLCSLHLVLQQPCKRILQVGRCWQTRGGRAGRRLSPGARKCPWIHEILHGEPGHWRRCGHRRCGSTRSLDGRKRRGRGRCHRGMGSGRCPDHPRSDRCRGL